MKGLLLLAVVFLAFANGANDNFKGVATLWGAGLTSYWRAIVWATMFTFVGSMAAAALARISHQK
jgi:inorganic phosphate transporter, PiT family